MIGCGVGIGDQRSLSSAPGDFTAALVGDPLLVGLMRPDPAVTTAPSGVTEVVNRGTGGNWTQAGLLALRPSLTTLGGRPALGFVGGQRLAATLGMPLDNWTVAFVKRTTSLAATRCACGVGASGHFSFVENDGSAAIGARAKGVGVTMDGPSVTSSQVVIWTRAAGTLALRVNGVQQTLDLPLLVPGAVSGDSPIGSLSPSASTFPYIGEIAEAVYYGGVFSAGQIADYTSSAMAYYSIT